MIYVSQDGIEEHRFRTLLEKTRERALASLATDGTVQVTGGDEFEAFITVQMKEAAIGTEFEGTIVQTGAHAFPDIIANGYFGVEVKVTTSNKWVSVGNSVLETTRTDGVQRIYLVFGKLGGVADIKFRPYQECLYDIGVTHSPRYKIDMELEAGASIFDKMNTEYERFRTDPNPISKVKEYYRGLLKEGEELWWIDPSGDEGAVNPIIQSFDTLSPDIKKQFFLESMILFPEIFGKSQTKFERVSAYLITAYNAVSSSLRDRFTAGGQQTIRVDGADIRIPRIYGHLYSNAPALSAALEGLSDEKLLYYWRLPSLSQTRLEHWKELVSERTRGSTFDGKSAVEIFEAGMAFHQD